MLFDSPVYFVFLIPVALVYWRLNHREQNIFLLLASYFFYGWWDWRFLALMICSTTADFLIAQKIDPTRADAARRKWFIFSLVLNFSILGTFKYFNFFVDSFSSALDTLGVHNIPMPLIRILLPPGISFYTFQEVAYIVDVYKGRLRPAKTFVEYGLFVSLFPHLIAGPIQRPGHLLPQVQKDRTFDADRVFDGIMLIFSGLIRKCVVADNCAVLANAAFGGQFGKPTLWVVLLGTYAFAWQVYGDFSGYSDIARGSAQLMGFHFMINFRQPYLSERLQEFWRRWHISLSSWLRDYLYIPLGGSRKGKVRQYVNLFITMLLGGFWHGASYNFIIWGGMHGSALSIDKVKMYIGEKLKINGKTFLMQALGVLVTFHFVCFCWIFFKASSLSDAKVVLNQITGNFDFASWKTIFSTYQNVLLIMLLGFILHGIPKSTEDKVKAGLAKLPLAMYVVIALLLFFLFLQMKTAEPVMPVYLQF